MRRTYRGAFGAPALAEKHGLDRTYVIEFPPGIDARAAAKALEALGDEVEAASPDGYGQVADPLIPADGQFNLQWNMHNYGQPVSGLPGTVDADIDAPEAWGIHTGASGPQVIVAVLDSGVLSHPEFGLNLGPSSTGRVLPGWNTVLNSGESSALQDNCGTGHGTHVAGIIAAAGGNSCGGGTYEPGTVCETAADCTASCQGGTAAGQPCATSNECPGGGTCGTPTCSAIGVAGVSWGAYIVPVKVMTSCGGSSTDLIEGIQWAADYAAGVDVINISAMYNLHAIIDQATITAMQSAVNYAHDRGIVVVAATGNNDYCSDGFAPSNDRVCYPARLANVLAVTATNSHDVLATFANYGAETDVAAPGQDIRSTINNGSYESKLGTSMAAPHVAGLAALIRSYVPELTNDEIAEIITATADDKGAAGWDQQYGYGRINAHQALLAAALWPGILESDPPDGAIDAGQPIHRLTLEPLGWDSVEVQFPRDKGSIASVDFAVEQNVAGTAPAVESVEPLDGDWVRVVFDRPIEPLAWTTITHVATGTRVRLGYLPGDVGEDGFTSPADIISLVDSLNGQTPRPLWAADVDRTNVANPADIITLIDLLNGIAPFPQSYNGAFLPEIP